MTSVTIARPVASRAAASILRPSSLCPWKLYGLVRGLNAPPRRPDAPWALRLWASETIWASLSTEQGPAITAIAGAADLQPSGLDHGPLGLELGRGPLVRGEDRHDLLDAIARLEGLGQALPLVADRGDHGPLGPDEDLRGHAQRLGCARPCAPPARPSRPTSSRRSRCPVLQGPAATGLGGRCEIDDGCRKNRRPQRKKPRDLSRSRGLWLDFGRSLAIVRSRTQPGDRSC